MRTYKFRVHYETAEGGHLTGGKTVDREVTTVDLYDAVLKIIREGFRLPTVQWLDPTEGPIIVYKWNSRLSVTSQIINALERAVTSKYSEE